MPIDNEFMRRILGTNVAEMITMDLYWYGENYIKEVYRVMCVFNTLYDEFKIRFDRRNCQLWVTNETNNFICSMEFINKIGILVFKLEFSEYDAIKIIDNLATYEENHMNEIYIPIDSCSTSMCSYTMKVERVDSSKSKISILQYNFVYENILTKISFELLSNEITESLLFQMYFSYLIDIDNGDYGVDRVIEDYKNYL